MQKFAAVFLLVGLVFVSSVSIAGTGADRCKRHTDCSDLEVCKGGQCESAIGRTYLVTVVGAKVSEKRTTAPHKGKAWDALGGLPDPRVDVYFPDIKTKAFVVTGKRDTTAPVWNATGKIVVSAAGQEIWFCFADQDSASHDALKTSSTGKGSCLGYRNIITFIRSGTFKAKTTGDIKSFEARIRRK